VKELALLKAREISSPFVCVASNFFAEKGDDEVLMAKFIIPLERDINNGG